MSFDNGIATYIVDTLEDEGFSFIRDVLGIVVQFKSVSSAVITSAVYSNEDGRTITVKASNLTGTLLSGNQSVNIILLVTYTNIL